MAKIFKVVIGFILVLLVFLSFFMASSWIFPHHQLILVEQQLLLQTLGRCTRTIYVFADRKCSMGRSVYILFYMSSVFYISSLGGIRGHLNC